MLSKKKKIMIGVVVGLSLIVTSSTVVYSRFSNRIPDNLEMQFYEDGIETKLHYKQISMKAYKEEYESYNLTKEQQEFINLISKVVSAQRRVERYNKVYDRADMIILNKKISEIYKEKIKER